MDILVEALKAFNYSPNGWDNARAVIGEEFYLSESVVRGLLQLDPPSVKVLDEDFKPIIFSTDLELAEKNLGLENTEEIEIPVDDEEIESTIEVEEKEEIVDMDEDDSDDILKETIEPDVEIEELSELESPHTIEELEEKVEASEKGADVIDMGVFFKAVQKSGSWYNVVKKGHEDTLLNDKGLSKKDLAEFVYNLYLKEA